LDSGRDFLRQDDGLENSGENNAGDLINPGPVALR